MNSRRNVLAGLATLALSAATPALAWPGSKRIVPSGKVASEARPGIGFTAIAVSLPGFVELSQGAADTITVEADDNLLPEITTEIEGGRLEIGFRHNLDVAGKATLRVKVTARRIESIAIAGGGNVAAAAIAGPELAVSISGSGNASLADVKTERLRASIAGSGDVTATGRADDVQVKIGGSGEFKAAQLESRHATVAIAGSGDATLWATESLRVSIAGAGAVRYRGDPVVTRKVAGSGRVSRLAPAA
jgi:hypothetical protein